MHFNNERAWRIESQLAGARVTVRLSTAHLLVRVPGKHACMQLVVCLSLPDDEAYAWVCMGSLKYVLQKLKKHFAPVLTTAAAGALGSLVGATEASGVVPKTHSV